MLRDSDTRPAHSWLWAACRLTAVLVGLVHAWAGRNRNLASGDATAYLDIADATGRGDWQQAVNPFWSPLYSWLLEVPLALFRPSPRDELLVVSLTNFVVYLAALACFDFLLRGLIGLQESRAASAGGEGRRTMPAEVWVVVGYSLFIWSSLALNHVGRVTPDVLFSAVVYAACGLTARVRAGRDDLKTFVLLGVTLGLGYLAKAVMFPLAFVFIVGSAFAVGRLGRAVPRTAVCLSVFLLTAAPFAAAVSRVKGRLTFGESGRLNYVWHVSGEREFIHWQGDASDRPAHPTRKIFDSPAAYEFAAPFVSSYPPWYDPSYWNEGRTPRFDPWRQLQAVRRNSLYVLRSYSLRSFVNGVAAALLLLLLAGRDFKSFRRGLAGNLFLILPSLAAFALYLLIHVEGRYVAAFAVTLILGLLASVRLPATEHARKAARLAAACVAAWLALSVGPSTLRIAYVSAREFARGEAGAPGVHQRVAEGLRRMGVKEGDAVASIGETMLSSWPRLARVRVVAEVPHRVSGVRGGETGEVEKFWDADAETRARVLEAFRAAGASAVVSDRAPDGAEAEGWQRIGDTKFHCHLLR